RRLETLDQLAVGAPVSLSSPLHQLCDLAPNHEATTYSDPPDKVGYTDADRPNSTRISSRSPAVVPHLAFAAERAAWDKKYDSPWEHAPTANVVTATPCETGAVRSRVRFG